MDVLLKIVGGLWAFLGALNLYMAYSADPGDSTSLAFGLILNMLVFILPGLAVYGIGVAISKKKTPPAKKTKSIASKPRLEDRLARLDDLLIQGAISEPEYDSRRSEILREI